MNETPHGLRLHIGIFGRRNVGKSHLINTLVGQSVSIVSDTPGTTTDVVTKPIELKPLGPVLFLDTAGIDDIGELGEKRVSKSMAAMDRVDVAFLVTDNVWGELEEWLITELKIRNIATIIVFNKCDIVEPLSNTINLLREKGYKTVKISAKNKTGFNELKNSIMDIIPKEYFSDTLILTDLVKAGDMVILVVPIDLEAPKGRLILPQVQVIREILDCDAKALVVKERELKDLLGDLKNNPKLVVTDSQAILKVNADVPDHIYLTSFSVLFARWKGDLESFVQGTKAIDSLKPESRILILESCAHHPIGEDIGRVKIPRWLQQYIGGKLQFDYCTGHDFPINLSGYSLIIHCGGCMTNRKEVLTRILRAQQAGVPISNYGLVIAKSLGVLKRILSPFPLMQSML